MTGVELALAVVPLVIVLVEHHRTVIRKTKAVTRSKTKNRQQLDFYNELYDELSLLKITLDRIETRPTKAGHKESRAESIQRALGENAQPFQIILDRVMKSINDLVSDKSVALEGHDTVRAVCPFYEQQSSEQNSVRQALCFPSLSSSNKHLTVGQFQPHSVTEFSSLRTRKVVT